MRKKKTKNIIHNLMRMKQLIAIIAALVWSVTASAQASLFKGTFVSEETGIQLHLDLEEETIEVPGLSFIGPTHGYLDGKTNNHVYGTWMLVKFSVEGNKAKLRFTNDIGSDSQDIVLVYNDDDKIDYNTTGGNCIRKVENRKLVKTQSSTTLHKK